MRFGNREYRIALIVITVVLALPILMHVINGVNSRMLADDYCFATNAIDRGLVGTMNFYYYNWQGTFSSTALQSVIALSGGGLVSWLPVLLIIGWWAGLIYLMWQLCALLGFQEIRLSAVALATLLLYGILEGTPTVFQSIYWTSGSVTYAVPMVLFTLWCGILLQIARATLPVYVVGVAAVVAGLFAGLMAGFSPIFAVFEIGILGLLLLAIWFRHPTHFGATATLLIMALIGAGIGTIIMVAAPGNSVRQSLFKKPDGLLALTGVNIMMTASYIGIDLSAFSLVPNLVLLVVGGWLIGRGMTGNSSIYARVKRSPRKWLFGALGIAFILLFAIFLPTSYNVSGFPPGRALIIPHFVTAVLVLTWGGVMALSLRKTAAGTGQVSKVMVIAIVALLLLGPVLAAGKSLALSPKLQTFAAEWDARDASLRQARNGSVTSVTVPQFSVDLADYVNVGAVGGEIIGCVESYYHIPTLIVQE
ncbi:MAG: hypothetical protein H0X30_27365 [Anaerolineae bacterium]|nr:hypothetical protein [Anaerolineae bacterium]